MTPSEIFEGENSSLRKTFDEATNTQTMEDRFNDEIHLEYAMSKNIDIEWWKKEILDFINQEISLARKEERERIVRWIQEQDWECFEQTFIKKDIINNLTTPK